MGYGLGFAVLRGYLSIFDGGRYLLEISIVLPLVNVWEILYGGC